MATTAAFKLVQATALSKTPAKVLVRWQTNITGADLADYEFYVERGEARENVAGFQHVDIRQQALPYSKHAATNNFRTISQAIDGLSDPWHLDFTPELRNLTASLNYRVRCRRKSTQEETTSGEVNFEGTLDLVGLYVVAEKDFELEDASGTPSLIYKRRRGGIPCTKCFDPVQKKRLISNCTVCYSTNWVGGFYDPVDAYVDFNPNPKNTQIGQFGETQTNETRVSMSNFPVVYPGDIIRELRQNRMWRVTQVNLTEKRRALLLQWPSVTEIKPGDVEYKMQVNEQFLLAKLEEFETTKKRREF